MNLGLFPKERLKTRLEEGGEAGRPSAQDKG